MALRTPMQRMLLSIVAACLWTACSGSRVEPPFRPMDNVDPRLVSEKSTPRNLTGDGKTIMEWELHGTSEEIAKACSLSSVRDRLMWMPLGIDERITRGVAYFEDLGRPRQPLLHELLADPDVRVALEDYDYSGPERGVEWCSLWGCSPKKRKLLYISMKG